MDLTIGKIKERLALDRQFWGLAFEVPPEEVREVALVLGDDREPELFLEFAKGMWHEAGKVLDWIAEQEGEAIIGEAMRE